MTADDSSDGPTDIPAAGGLTSESDAAAAVGDGSAELLELTVQHPSAGVCVVMVAGELDMLTTPLLDACLREQLTAVPTHLVLDLASVRFFSSTALNCLLLVHELVQQMSGTQLHLAGLTSRVVSRSLRVTGLLELFDAYPTLADALAALAK